MAEKKEDFVKLKVDQALPEDDGKGIVRVDREFLHKIGADVGDVLEIEGTRKTVAIAADADEEIRGLPVIRMDGLTRRNAGVSIGDYVIVRKAKVKPAKLVVLAPADKNTYLHMDKDYIEYRVKPSLLGRPVLKGDIIKLGGTRRRKRFVFDEFDIFGSVIEEFIQPFGFPSIRFIVVNTVPKGPVIITKDTEIEVRQKAPPTMEERIPEVTYEDIGDLEEAKRKIREIVELPLKHPELFEHLGIEPPKGVLLYGPPGCGKTLLAKAVANESDAYFIAINGPEIMSKWVGEAEKRIREIFEEAEKNAPAIIFIDEIDAIAPKREEVVGEVEKRIVAQLLACMDGLKSRGRVIVIAATNRPDALDPALRRPGRFDREIEIPVPNEQARYEIFKVHTRNMPIEPPFDPAVVEDYLKKLLEKIEEEKEDIEILEEECKKLREEIEKLEKERDKVLNDLKKIDEELKELRRERDSIRRDLSRYEEYGYYYQYGSEYDKLSSKLRDLDAKIESLQIRKRKLEEKLADLDSKISGRKSVLSRKESTIERIRKSRKLKKLANKISISDIVGITEVYLEFFRKFKEAIAEQVGDENVRKRILSASSLDEIKRILRGPGGESALELDKVVLTKDFIKKYVLDKLSGRAKEVIGAILDVSESDEEFWRVIERGVQELLGVEEWENLRDLLRDALLRKLAKRTHGYTGADIAALCREAAMNAIRRHLPEIMEKVREGERIPPEILSKIKVTLQDFEEAMKIIRPTQMREFFVERPKVRWEDIGGLEDVKQELKEAIEWPLKYPELFTKFGIEPPKGILLYGPPGCGKTLLAKAVAGETECNFIYVRCSDILSKWYGESEKAIRRIFARARQVAPCIIFFDEIDAIAPRRTGSEIDRVTERVVNQLLMEMDGLEELSGVVVIAATNRPDILDPALLRPGRFDRKIFVPPPDRNARYEIFLVHTRNIPIDREMWKERLSALVSEGKLEQYVKELEGDDIVKKKFQKEFETFKNILAGFKESLIEKLEEAVKSDRKLLDFLMYAFFWKDIVDKTEGYTGADIAAVCKEAAMFAMREMIETYRGDPKKIKEHLKEAKVTREHFEKALKKIGPSLSREEIEYYKNLEKFLKEKKAPKTRPKGYVV